MVLNYQVKTRRYKHTFVNGHVKPGALTAVMAGLSCDLSFLGCDNFP